MRLRVITKLSLASNKNNRADVACSWYLHCAHPSPGNDTRKAGPSSHTTHYLSSNAAKRPCTLTGQSLGRMPRRPQCYSSTAPTVNTAIQTRCAPQPPYHTIPYHTIPYHTIPYHTIPYHTIPYHTIPYHTIPYHTIPYYIPQHTYHTIPIIPCHHVCMMYVVVLKWWHTHRVTSYV